jgi:hypothetical protein
MNNLWIGRVIGIALGLLIILVLSLTMGCSSAEDMRGNLRVVYEEVEIEGCLALLYWTKIPRRVEPTRLWRTGSIGIAFLPEIAQPESCARPL